MLFRSQKVGLSQLPLRSLIGANPVVGLFGNPMVFGSYLALASPLLLSASGIFGRAGYPIEAIAVYVTGSASACVVLLITLAAYYVISLKKFWPVLAVLAGSAVAAYLLIWDILVKVVHFDLHVLSSFTLEDI